MLGLTFLVVGVLQPLGAKQIFGKHFVPSRNDERSPLLNHMDIHQILEFLLAEIPDLRRADTDDPAQVGRIFNEAMEIQIGRDGIELRLGMHWGGHDGRRSNVVASFVRC